MFEILSQLKPEVIVTGGATLVSFYLIYSHIIKDRNIMKIMSNHLEHDLEQREKDNESRDLLSKTLQKLVDVINTKIK